MSVYQFDRSTLTLVNDEPFALKILSGRTVSLLFTSHTLLLRIVKHGLMEDSLSLYTSIPKPKKLRFA